MRCQIEVASYSVVQSQPLVTSDQVTQLYSRRSDRYHPNFLISTFHSTVVNSLDIFSVNLSEASKDSAFGITFAILDCSFPSSQHCDDAYAAAAVLHKPRAHSSMQTSLWVKPDLLSQNLLIQSKWTINTIYGCIGLQIQSGSGRSDKLVMEVSMQVCHSHLTGRYLFFTHIVHICRHSDRDSDGPHMSVESSSTRIK